MKLTFLEILKTTICEIYDAVVETRQIIRNGNKLRDVLKVHKIENFFGFDFEICTFS